MEVKGLMCFQGRLTKCKLNRLGMSIKTNINMEILFNLIANSEKKEEEKSSACIN